MEGTRVRSIVMVCLVFGMLIGQSTASFKDCYVGCFVGCVVQKSALLCGIKCLKDCITIKSSLLDDTHYYCKLGCASSMCSNLSTKENPRGEKVEGCVGSCSKTCTKNYLSSKNN